MNFKLSETTVNQNEIISMNLIYGRLALHEFSIAQRIEHPPSVSEVIGSNPVTELKIHHLSFFQYGICWGTIF